MAFQGSKCTTFVTTQAMAEKFLLARGLVLQWYIFIMCKPCKNLLHSISFLCLISGIFQKLWLVKTILLKIILLKIKKLYLAIANSVKTLLRQCLRDSNLTCWQQNTVEPNRRKCHTTQRFHINVLVQQGCIPMRKNCIWQ